MVDRVVLFVIDGLRPDGLKAAQTPHIDGLYHGGCYTYHARTVMPSATLPCHTSMFRGVPPERHGITTNTWIPQVRPVPSVIDVVHSAGLRTCSFYNWEPLRDLSDPGSLDLSCFMNNCDRPEGDLELADQATASLNADDGSGFAFVYLGHTDIAGHNHGWMSDPYLRAVENADRAIGLVLAALDAGRTAIIVTSDHGGHGRTHGTDADDDMLIPWGLQAPQVRQEVELVQPVNIVDNAPTIAALLNTTAPAEWSGRPVPLAGDR